MPTNIEWAEETWNPITGCTKISEGCKVCYAERMSKRLAGRYGYPKDGPFNPGVFHYNQLEKPIFWRTPRKIFVCSMGDIFHKDVRVDDLDRVFDVIELCPQHTFIVLTKRPENIEEKSLAFYHNGNRKVFDCGFPPNVWLGVTIENQKQASKRIPILLQIPAAVRFVSVEPMLGPVDLELPSTGYGSGGSGGAIEPKDCHIPGDTTPRLDWVICGGESGPGARPMHPDWVRSLRDQCVEADVPFLFKQWGEWGPSCNHGLADNGVEGAKETVIPPYAFYRIGKKKAGRLLDGKEWNQYPKT